SLDDPAAKESGGAPTDIIQLDADDIIVRVVRSADEKKSKSAASDVWLTGNVVVKHLKPNQEPTVFSGTELHMRNEGENRQFVTLLGDDRTKTPAKIVNNGRIFEGLHLEFDRYSEQGQAIGRGHIYLPMDRDLEGKKMSKTQPLDLKWATSMRFDGKTAIFYGDANALLKNGDSQSQRIRADQIIVDFDRRFKMTDSPNGKKSGQPKVAKIRFVGHVELKSAEFENGDVSSYQVGNFRELTLDQESGDLFGQGPGSLKSWRPGRKGRANLSPVASVQANTPLQSTSGDLEFAWIDFVGRMKGNIKRRLTTFYDEVRIVYGPVTKMSQQINPDDVGLQRLPKNSGYMRCNWLELHQPPGKNRFLILKGNGNVELEGHDFRAQADQISFDQAKEQFLLRAIGNANVATIWRQTQVGSEPSSQSGRRWIFIPSRGILKSDDAQNIKGFDPGNLSRPAPGFGR
ncbi:hypothetical protein OAH18_02160, partial [bacterium]|nr:hypothetical protein [bacterium]